MWDNKIPKAKLVITYDMQLIGYQYNKVLDDNQYVIMHHISSSIDYNCCHIYIKIHR
jgi:hypothetical protein